MDNQRDLLSLMLKIRKAEEKIVEVYARDQKMRTPTHLSIGQEAVAAALAVALLPGDQVFTGHRCHAAYLAKNGDYEGFFAELCGRASGVSAGRAGSAHLTDPSVGIYSSPILGATIPVAVGAALSFEMDQKKDIAVAVFGDATVEEGVFAESVNFAVTKKLPVLFVCENNLYSTHSPLSVRQPPSPIFERVRMNEFPTEQVDGNDVLKVYEAFRTAIKYIRYCRMPFFVECLTYRVREHVGPLHDYDRGYRTKEEVDQWLGKCPIARLSKTLFDEKIMTHTEIDKEEEKWAQMADDAYTKALQSPWPDALSMTEHVY
ncbi:MAG: thiamine pyrophosphate-dependent dehydrogenase E1 component subunit alpha [Candidatus Omnitrophica bacterium]|nr:thiamine pyrophosphate-dependent dehydrogenase E1 component subunit alpha [Candidatus Omnitrophota bacterium]